MSNASASVAIRVPSSPTDWVKASFGIVLLGLLVYAFAFQRAENEASTYGWLIGHWNNISNYSHGPLIPLIASFLLYWNIHQRAPANTNWDAYWHAMAASGATLGIWMVGGSIKKSWDEPSYYLALKLLPISLVWQIWTLRDYLRSDQPPRFWSGLAVIVTALLIYYVGIKSTQPRVTVVAGVLLLLGLARTLCGPDIMKQLFFPIVFLLLMVPLNFIENSVGFKLQLFVAKYATVILNNSGIRAQQEGTSIISSVFHFNVAAPCSGIRSLMALTTITAAFGYVTQHVQWKRWLLFLSAMPLAVLGNMVRVISIAVVAQVYGQTAAKQMHEWSGFIVFPVALAAMVLIGVMMNFDYRGLIQHWLQPPPTPVRNE